MQGGGGGDGGAGAGEVVAALHKHIMSNSAARPHCVAISVVSCCDLYLSSMSARAAFVMCVDRSKYDIM